MTRIHYRADSPFSISKAVRAGDFVITYAVGDHGFQAEDVRHDANGLVLSDGTDRSGVSFEEEVHGTFRNIERALEPTGATLADVVDIQVWLRDPRHFGPFNAIYSAYFKENFPVRQVFRTDFMFDCRVELKVMAYKPLATT